MSLTPHPTEPITVHMNHEDLKVGITLSFCFSWPTLHFENDGGSFGVVVTVGVWKAVVKSVVPNVPS